MDKQAIYDARKLGKPKMVVLGIQHMFAMFGATILVPMITGLDVLTTLLMAGLGTLLFHFITKFKVPAFLGSSFAFLGGYAAVKALAPEGADPNSMLPYAFRPSLPVPSSSRSVWVLHPRRFQTAPQTGSSRSLPSR